jgi:hypothetical protein
MLLVCCGLTSKLSWYYMYTEHMELESYMMNVLGKIGKIGHKARLGSVGGFCNRPLTEVDRSKTFYIWHPMSLLFMKRQDSI